MNNINEQQPPQRSEAYAKSGVNLDAAEVFGRFTGQLCKESYENSPFVTVNDWSQGHFRGPRPFHFKGLPEDVGILTAPDGIGTKTIMISAVGACDSAPSNLLEMPGMDIGRWGGLSLAFINHLEPKTLGKPEEPLFMEYQGMMRSLAAMAKEQKYVLINGETAQMGVCVSSEIVGKEYESTMPIFNWSAVMIGVITKDKLIDGSTLASGQRVIALRDDLRSNGASLCRRYLREVYGPEWWKNPDAKPSVTAMASPSALYSRFLATMNGWYDPELKSEFKMHAIAHISGGGILAKFGEGLLFPGGFTAVLEDLWEPPQFMKDCAAHMKMPDQEIYTVFNGGQGALVVIDEADSDRFCARAKDFGVQAQDTGHIERADTLEGGEIKIKSKFSGEWFPLRERWS